jgi:hypothetical protein
MILQELIEGCAQPHRVDGLVKQKVILCLGLAQSFGMRVATDAATPASSVMNARRLIPAPSLADARFF